MKKPHKIMSSNIKSDTIESFEGAASLVSSNGLAVVSNFGDPILLSPF